MCTLQQNKDVVSARAARRRNWFYRAWFVCLTDVARQFQGHLSSRWLARSYTSVLDWTKPVDLEPAVFQASTVFDTLNRPLLIDTRGSSTRRAYNLAGHVASAGW